MKKYFLLKRGQFFIITFIVLLAIYLIFIVSGSSKAVETSTKNKLIPIYCTKQDEKIVSLSFDAAWGNEDTTVLIDILNKYGVKANFFLVGEWVDKYPESVKQLSEAGMEIGNHSDTHPNMTKLSKDDILKQINNCNDKIEKITGKRPVLFRAPYGAYNNNLIETLDSVNMKCIQWDVDSIDWKDIDAEQILSRVKNKVSEGSIILFHNAAKNTPEALPQVIEYLQSEGYKIVPISQQLYSGETTIDHEGRQIPVQP